jgi:uncharacterized protein (TIGR02996 family)
MDEREAFIEAIREKPRDLVTRKVFADWLDEHDEPELADHHRSWTEELYDEAIEWMNELASQLSTDEFDDVTIDQLIEAGWKYVRDGETSCVGGQGFTAEGLIAQRTIKEEYWKYWHVLADTIERPKSDYMDGKLFTCGC